MARYSLIASRISCEMMQSRVNDWEVICIGRVHHLFNYSWKCNQFNSNFLSLHSLFLSSCLCITPHHFPIMLPISSPAFSFPCSYELNEVEFVEEHSHEFDVLIFTQRWPITSCLEWMEEKKNNVCLLPSQKGIWTIHGIWPTRFGSIGPAFCNKSAIFDVDTLKPFMEQLQQFWLNIEKGKPKIVISSPNFPPSSKIQMTFCLFRSTKTCLALQEHQPNHFGSMNGSSTAHVRSFSPNWVQKINTLAKVWPGYNNIRCHHCWPNRAFFPTNISMCYK